MDISLMELDLNLGAIKVQELLMNSGELKTNGTPLGITQQPLKLL